jgi:C4-dicarboxylate-specific signal transduction histidine kinase
MADLVAEPAEDLEEILRDACGHLGRSIDLLARVVNPPPASDIVPISVSEPIAFVANLQRAGRTHVRVELDVDPSLPAAAGVARHLEHALLNLILYATDLLRVRDTGLLRIAARPEADELRITVAWDHPPVAPELEARLFELPADHSSVDQPLSIGIPVAREAARLSGGTLTYSPDEGPGPCFQLSLPQWRRGGSAQRAGSR